MSIKKGSSYIAGTASGSGRNIGDIFYTKRTDTALAGAVECNGGTYSTADYTGIGSIGELLAGGKLDYISLSDYATAISTKGWCDKIGWDGTGTTSFRVPTLTPYTIQENNTDAAQLRVMFQLFNATTDEAVATVGTVVAQVVENTTQIANRVVKGHELIAFQIPTEANGYTWYRKYADGWVEQGQDVVSSTGTRTVSFPVEMADTNYTILKTMQTNSGSQPASYNQFAFYNKTTTGATTGSAGVGFSWQVSGMAK